MADDRGNSYAHTVDEPSPDDDDDTVLMAYFSHACDSHVVAYQVPKQSLCGTDTGATVGGRKRRSRFRSALLATTNK